MDNVELEHYWIEEISFNLNWKERIKKRGREREREREGEIVIKPRKDFNLRYDNGFKFIFSAGIFTCKV